MERWCPRMAYTDESGYFWVIFADSLLLRSKAHIRGWRVVLVRIFVAILFP